MWQWIKNVLTLCQKELQSLFSDKMIIFIIGFLFSGAIYIIATGITTEVNNATVAVVDHDQSAMSRYLVSTLQPPSFQQPFADRHDLQRESGHGQRIAADRDHVR